MTVAAQVFDVAPTKICVCGAAGKITEYRHPLPKLRATQAFIESWRKHNDGPSSSIGNHFVSDGRWAEAVIPERKLVTEALKRGIGEVSVEETAKEVRSRSLVRREVAGRDMVTTKDMLALEAKVIDFARQGRGRCRPLGNPERPLNREWFNEGQKAAVRHVLSSRDRVMIIRGAAGTGKTTLEQEIGEATQSTSALQALGT